MPKLLCRRNGFQVEVILLNFALFNFIRDLLAEVVGLVVDIGLEAPDEIPDEDVSDKVAYDPIIGVGV